MNQEVEYRDVPGMEGYRVGSDGSVWSRHRPGHRLTNKWTRLRATALPPSGYLQVKLRPSPKVSITRYVHRLVLEAFIGTCPPGMEACHDPDPSPSNNRLVNLRWDTPRGNADDRIRHGNVLVGDCCPSSKISVEQAHELVRLRLTGQTQQQLADRFGITQTTVSRILRGKNRRYIGRNEQAARPLYFKLTKETYREIQSLHAQGLSSSAIGRKTGISRRYVSQLVSGEKKPPHVCD